MLVLAVASAAAFGAVAGCGEPVAENKADDAATATDAGDTVEPTDTPESNSVDTASSDTNSADDTGPAAADTTLALSDVANDASSVDDGEVDDAGSAAADGQAEDDDAADTGPQDTYDPLQLNDSTTAPPPTCGTWCAAMSQNCAKAGLSGGGKEADKLLADTAACTKWCEATPKWAAGKSGHAFGNTLACRAHHAKEAAASGAAAQNHCPAAGLSGGGVCGTYCDNYCHTMQTLCPAAYSKTSDCDIECKGVLAEYGDKVPCLIKTALNLGGAGALCADAKVFNGKTKACNQKLPDAAATVKTQGITFLPKEVTVTVGESVLFAMPQGHNAVQVSENEWQNNGNKTLPGGFVVPFGATKLVPFNKVGLVHYVCQVHAQQSMKGRITVKPAKGP